MGFIIAGILWVLGMCMMKMWFDDTGEDWHLEQTWWQKGLCFGLWFLVIPFIMFVDWQSGVKK